MPDNTLLHASNALSRPSPSDKRTDNFERTRRWISARAKEAEISEISLKAARLLIVHEYKSWSVSTAGKLQFDEHYIMLIDQC